MNPMLPVIDIATDRWVIDSYVNSDATRTF